MLAWSVEAFAAARTVERVVVAAPPGREEEIAAAVAVAAAGGELAADVVTGAGSRAGSVAAALDAVESELVAVHDAARPLVTPGLIDAVLRRLAARPDVAGVIAAAPIADTVKRVHQPRRPDLAVEELEPEVTATESREHLWAAQTPQAFRVGALREAHAGAERSAATTDDAMLVEAGGGRVLIYPSPAENLKVTTAHDLRLADLLLAGRPGPGRGRDQ